MENYSTLFTPGLYVINPNKEQEWGIGQIQSSINNLITVNFENVGKKTINLEFKKSFDKSFQVLNYG